MIFLQQALDFFRTVRKNDKKQKQFIDNLNPYALEELQQIYQIATKELNLAGDEEEKKSLMSKGFLRHFIDKVYKRLPVFGGVSIIVLIMNTLGKESAWLAYLKTQDLIPNKFPQSMTLALVILIYSVLVFIILSYRKWILGKNKILFCKWYDEYEDYIVMKKRELNEELIQLNIHDQVINFFKSCNKFSEQAIISTINNDKNRLNKTLKIMSKSNKPLKFSYKRKKLLLLMTFTVISYMLFFFTLEPGLLKLNLIVPIFILILMFMFIIFSGGWDAIKSRIFYQIKIYKIKKYIRKIKKVAQKM